MNADTDIEITDYHFDELPALEFYLSRECSADDNKYTTLEIRSGENVPHTTIRMVPAMEDPTTYYCLWWTYNQGDDLFHAFAMPLGDSNGYDMLRRILAILDRHTKEGDTK